MPMQWGRRLSMPFQCLSIAVGNGGLPLMLELDKTWEEVAAD
jgi:hypothetical protein